MHENKLARKIHKSLVMVIILDGPSVRQGCYDLPAPPCGTVPPSGVRLLTFRHLRARYVISGSIPLGSSCLEHSCSSSCPSPHWAEISFLEGFSGYRLSISICLTNLFLWPLLFFRALFSNIYFNLLNFSNINVLSMLLLMLNTMLGT